MTSNSMLTFTFLNWDYEPQSGELQLHYQDEQFGRFTEQFVFPALDAVRLDDIKKPLTTAINCLHWMAGVSYYKTSLASNIEFTQQKPNQQQANWLNQTWQSGLAELAYENQLPWLDYIDFSFVENTTSPSELNLQPRSLVAIGGGKDSLVTIEQLKKQGEDFCLFQVGQSAFIQSVAEQTDVPLIQVKRQLDGRLHEANKQGAYNGHVPITAINSCVAVITALIADFDSVVFSNERSAEFGNVTDEQGRSINHQYSKSLAFEQAWEAIIKDYITSDLDYFSLLRPFSELHIVKKFAEYEPYFASFSSCNRNFHLAGSQNKQHHWCGQCPKCAFVFLCLAPFVPRQTLVKIFGQDLLANKQLNGLFAELLGLEGQKPFECVGEASECRQALRSLAKHQDWQQHPQVEYWMDAIGDSREGVGLFKPSHQHQIPAKRKFQRVLTDMESA